MTDQEAEHRLNQWAKDTDDLRDYMSLRMGLLRPERSTASYAVEYIRTMEANLATAQARTKALIVAGDLVAVMERAQRIASDLQVVAQRVAEMKT